MSLQDLGNLGEFIGAIAVVISLVYLAAQIRQNTKTVRSSTYQAVLDSSRSDNELILVYPHLERVFRVGRRDPSALTDEERPLFRLLVAQLLQNHEVMFLQYQHGIIDEELWRRRKFALRALVSQPGVRQWWTGPTYIRDAFDSGFQELLDSLLANGTGQDEPAA